MNTVQTNNEQGKAGKAGKWQANGFKVTEQGKISTVSSYCFRCGKLKSEHKFLMGCPK